MIRAERRLKKKGFDAAISNPEPAENAAASGVGELLAGSLYLKTIAVIILVSVVVSTIIDFHFKIGAKQAYPSTRELAGFFSSYYGWLKYRDFICPGFAHRQDFEQVRAGAKPVRHSQCVAYRFARDHHLARSVGGHAHADGGRNPTEQYSSKWDGSYLYGRTDECRESDQDISGRGRRKSWRCRRRIHYFTVQPRRSGEIHLLPSFHLCGTDL